MAYPAIPTTATEDDWRKLNALLDRIWRDESMRQDHERLVVSMSGEAAIRHLARKYCLATATVRNKVYAPRVYPVAERDRTPASEALARELAATSHRAALYAKKVAADVVEDMVEAYVDGHWRVFQVQAEYLLATLDV